MPPVVVSLAYLIAAVLFIVGIKGLARPRTAMRANLASAAGMLLAVVVTLLDRHIVDYRWIAVGLAIGTLLGAWLAVRVKMTAMPQMVALLNGSGGGASVLVAGTALLDAARGSPAIREPGFDFLLATVASGIIGAVTFTGSIVAYAKLEERLAKNPFARFGPYAPTVAVAVATLLTGGLLMARPEWTAMYALLSVLAGVLGVLLVIPIGGADMPVVIALLNSYSGLAAAATGFVFSNSVLIVAGSLVGASGIILCRIMCRAMNRSLLSVLFGTVGTAAAVDKSAADAVYAGRVKSTTAEEVALLLEAARLVVIVPGYGMAVAQAQHAVRDLAKLLESRGTTVEFGIHPVAGRMPGHMNVLLAEANVPYDRVKELDQINPRFTQADVVLVIGANDVVNPLADTDPASPIAGMPILEVGQARTVVVIKRSLSPGFAGIPNPLFAADNTLLYFADGAAAVVEIANALKAA